MDVGCNCFNVATAAKVPVKRYNLLVPALFPVTEPSASKQLGIATEKNIKRLGEYLERNEHRIPKVSRRLARRLESDLRRGKLGYVYVAVAAFSHLVKDDGGRYARLYTPELIGRYPAPRRHLWSCAHGPAVPPASPHLGSVVGLLLAAPAPLAQQWGLDLLVDLLKVQESAESVGQLEALVPLLCRKAALRHVVVEPLSGGGGRRGRGASGDGGAERELVVAGALRALLEHLRYCARVAYVSRHLDAITYAVLGTLEAAGQAMLDPGAVADAARAAAGGAPPAVLRTVSIGARVGSSPPGVAALLVYQELGAMTVDAAEGRKVLEFLLRFLDAQPARWLGGPALSAGLGVMRAACEQQHQRYLLYATLMAHAGGAAAAALAPAQRSAVLAQAMVAAAGLDPGMAAPALLLALRELPKALAAAGHAGDEPDRGGGGFAAEVEAAASALARRVGNGLQLTSVLGSAVGGLQGPGSPEAAAALQCCAAAAQAYAHLPAATGGGATPGAAPPAGRRHLSDVLLRSLVGVCVSWPAPHRLHAHTITSRALSGAGPGSLAPAQAHVLLSALWHEAALPDNAPASCAAMEACFGDMLGAAPDASPRLQACRVAAALQAGAAAGGGRLGGATAAQRCALLAATAAMWGRLAAALRCPELAALGAPGALAVLPSLQAAPGGTGLAVRAGRGEPAAGLALAPFTAEDEALAAAFLSSLPERAAAPLEGLLASVPEFAGLPAERLAAPFAPAPARSLLPHMPLGALLDSRPPQGRDLSLRARRVMEALEADHPAQAEPAGGAVGEVVAPSSPPVAGEAAAPASKGGGVPAPLSLRVKTMDEVLAGVQAALSSAVRAEC